MSWGERSCKWKQCPIPDECNYFSCTVNCPKYEWDKKTKPDTRKMTKKELRGFLSIVQGAINVL